MVAGIKWPVRTSVFYVVSQPRLNTETSCIVRLISCTVQDRLTPAVSGTVLPYVHMHEIDIDRRDVAEVSSTEE